MTHSSYDAREEEDKLGTQYDVTADELMTSNPLEFEPSERVEHAYDELETHDFDAAPVVRSEPDGTSPLCGYISRFDIGDTSGTVDEQMVDVKPSQEASPDTPFREILTKLSSSRFLFVTSESGVVGILTRYDLNSLPAYAHLYSKIGQFEVSLRNGIRSTENWESKTDVSPHTKTNLRGVTYDWLSSKSLNKLCTVARDVGLVEELGLAEYLEDVELSDVSSLRGNIAHYNPVVHTMKDYAPKSDRNTKTAFDLHSEYEFIEFCLDRLSEYTEE